MTRVVVQRPDWGDLACKWGSQWIKDVVLPLARSTGYTTVDLYGDDAVRSRVLAECSKTDFEYFTGVGHGDFETFTGQELEKIFWLGDSETKKICRNKHFNFLSCRFGAIGARWMRTIGRAAGVHAYNSDFIFLIDEDDFPNNVAMPFFDSHTVVDRVLLKGGMHFTAHLECVKRFTHHILTGPEECRRYLVWDRNHKVFYGNWLKRLKKDSACFG
jgi:hypothetical protein